MQILQFKKKRDKSCHTGKSNVLNWEGVLSCVWNESLRMWKQTAAVWEGKKSDAYSQELPALHWSHTGCRPRCPENHVAPCRTHRLVVTNDAIFESCCVSKVCICVLTSCWRFSVKAEWTTAPPLPPLNRSPAPFLTASSLSPEPAKENPDMSFILLTELVTCYFTSPLVFGWGKKNIVPLLSRRSSRTDLFKVSKLDELHGHLRVLQLHGFAHSGLGVCRGQTNQGLQRTGRHRRGLRRRRRKRRGNMVRARLCGPYTSGTGSFSSARVEVLCMQTHWDINWE